MGALGSREAHDALLRELLASPGMQGEPIDSKRRLVLVPMTKQFMNRTPVPPGTRGSTVPTADAPEQLGAASPLPAGPQAHSHRASSEGGQGMDDERGAPLGASARPPPSDRTAGAEPFSNVAGGSRGAGGGVTGPRESPAAWLDLDGRPEDFPLVRQVYAAYGEPHIRFFCRKDGWGPSLAQMPQQLLYPTIEEFYEATVAHYTSLVERSFPLRRPWSYTCDRADVANTTAPPAVTPTPPPIPCAICFQYPTSRLATTDAPYNPSVYAHRYTRLAFFKALCASGNARGQAKDPAPADPMGSGGSRNSRAGVAGPGGTGDRDEDGDSHLLAPPDSVVFSRGVALAAIGFVGLVPTRLTGSLSRQGHTPLARRSRFSGGEARPEPTWTEAPAGTQNPVPFVKPPPSWGGERGVPLAPGDADLAAPQSRVTGEVEYEVVLFLSRAGGSLFVARALLMAIHLFVAQCERLGHVLVAVSPIRYSVMLTDTTLLSALRELRDRVERMCAMSGSGAPTGAIGSDYESLRYYLRHGLRLTEGCLEGRLPPEAVLRLFQLVHRYWSLSESAQGVGGPEEPAGLLPAPGSHARREPPPVLPSTASEESVLRARAILKDSPTTPPRYFFYGIVRDAVRMARCSPRTYTPVGQEWPPGGEGQTAHSPTRPPSSSSSSPFSSLPLIGGPGILNVIRTQLDWARREASVRRSPQGKAAPAHALRPTEAAGSGRASGQAGRQEWGVLGELPSAGAARSVPMAPPSGSTLPPLMGANLPPWIYVYAVVGRAGPPTPQPAGLSPGEVGDGGDALQHPTGSGPNAGGALDQVGRAAEVDRRPCRYPLSAPMVPPRGRPAERARGTYPLHGPSMPPIVERRPDYWPVGTVLRQLVELPSGRLLLAHWEPAPISNEVAEVLTMGGEGQAGPPATGAAAWSSHPSRLQARRPFGDASSSGSGTASTRASSTALGSPRSEWREALRMVSPLDVIVSWARDSHRSSRVADRSAAGWRCYCPSGTDMKAVPIHLPPPLPRHTQRPPVERADASRQSPLPSAPHESLGGPPGQESTAEERSYVWEFVHCGKTYGILLRPNFLQDKDEPSSHAGEGSSAGGSGAAAATAGRPPAPVARTGSGASFPGSFPDPYPGQMGGRGGGSFSGSGWDSGTAPDTVRGEDGVGRRERAAPPQAFASIRARSGILRGSGEGGAGGGVRPTQTMGGDTAGVLGRADVRDGGLRLSDGHRASPRPAPDVEAAPSLSGSSRTNTTSRTGGRGWATRGSSRDSQSQGTASASRSTHSTVSTRHRQTPGPQMMAGLEQRPATHHGHSRLSLSASGSGSVVGLGGQRRSSGSQRLSRTLSGSRSGTSSERVAVESPRPSTGSSRRVRGRFDGFERSAGRSLLYKSPSRTRLGTPPPPPPYPTESTAPLVAYSPPPPQPVAGVAQWSFRRQHVTHLQHDRGPPPLTRASPTAPERQVPPWVGSPRGSAGLSHLNGNGQPPRESWAAVSAAAVYSPPQPPPPPPASLPTSAARGPAGGVATTTRTTATLPYPMQGPTLSPDERQWMLDSSTNNPPYPFDMIDGGGPAISHHRVVPAPAPRGSALSGEREQWTAGPRVDRRPTIHVTTPPSIPTPGDRGHNGLQPQARMPWGSLGEVPFTSAGGGGGGHVTDAPPLDEAPPSPGREFDLYASAHAHPADLPPPSPARATDSFYGTAMGEGGQGTSQGLYGGWGPTSFREFGLPPGRRGSQGSYSGSAHPSFSADGVGATGLQAGGASTGVMDDGYSWDGGAGAGSGYGGPRPRPSSFLLSHNSTSGGLYYAYDLGYPEGGHGPPPMAPLTRPEAEAARAAPAQARPPSGASPDPRFARRTTTTGPPPVPEPAPDFSFRGLTSPYVPAMEGFSFAEAPSARQPFVDAGAGSGEGGCGPDDGNGQGQRPPLRMGFSGEALPEPGLAHTRPHLSQPSAVRPRRRTAQLVPLDQPPPSSSILPQQPSTVRSYHKGSDGKPAFSWNWRSGAT